MKIFTLPFVCFFTAKGKGELYSEFPKRNNIKNITIKSRFIILNSVILTINIILKVFMNIFILDYNPVRAAQYQCDKHVVKMILESAQIMSTVAHKNNIQTVYKPTHANHPCTIWAGSYKDNYDWLIHHALALCEEYTYRYNKIHKSQKIIESLTHVSDILKKGCSEFVQCVPEDLKQKCVVESYRAYYKTKDFVKWSVRDKPYWF